MSTVPGFQLTPPYSPADGARYESLLQQAELVTEGEMRGGKRCQNTLSKQIVTPQWISVSEVTVFITFGDGLPAIHVPGSNECHLQHTNSVVTLWRINESELQMHIIHISSTESPADFQCYCRCETSNHQGKFNRQTPVLLSMYMMPTFFATLSACWLNKHFFSLLHSVITVPFRSCCYTVCSFT